MNVIEKRIHEHFARLQEDEAANSREAITTGTPPSATIPSFSLPEAPLQPPFAKVNTVAAGGPAEAAGLKAGDEIRNFGYVNISNHDGLKRVAECVQGNEGVSHLV